MANFRIGIDLGTTNTVLAYVDAQDESAEVKVFNIPQYVDASNIEARPSLPSFMYLGTDSETYQLPWQQVSSSQVIGTWARVRASKVPDRIVAAAKSWLVNGQNKEDNLLPVNAPDDVARQTPFAVTQAILGHLVRSWDHAHPENLFVNQEIVLTVPASFDATARDLTREAALAAGFGEAFTILEEPQAALYAWLSLAGESWRKQLAVGDSLLIVDVGGGTTDFSLIKVEDSDGALALNRIAVGKHLLVGGDNMDLALAHFAAQKFSDKNINLDAWQNVALWHSCRDGKESLLGAGDVQSHTISIAGKGRSLIGGSVSVGLDKQTVQDFLCAGFFPEVNIEDAIEKPSIGFVQVGLAYESDAAITRHLAAFLREQNMQSVSHILFNGGVFKSPVFQEKIVSSIGRWLGESPALLDGTSDLDVSVARGACYYSQVKAGKGLRIRGGASRAYYLGFESATMAIPGMPRPMQGLCVVPRGMEEGSMINIPCDPLGLVTGQDISFPFFSSTTRAEDEAGIVLPQVNELEKSDVIRTHVPALGRSDGEVVSVKLQAELQETGALALWAVSIDDGQRWKFEFNARED